MSTLQINSYHHILYIVTGSLLFLLSGLFIVNFLHPFTIDNSYAESEDFDATVNVASNLSVSATDVTITDTPEANGSWLTGTSNVVVSTNNATGYKLYISSADDQVDLINTDNNKYKISNLESETTESNFKNSADLMNYYGFTTNNNGSDTDLGQITTGTYLPLTDNNNARLINATTEKKNISQTDVTFATKVDRSIPAGEYTNTITFTAIANPVVTTLNSLDDAAADGSSLMQDVDTNTCSNTTADNSKLYTLTDSRTTTTYKIRKLTVDNKCWMMGNLYLPLGTVIDSEKSNVDIGYSYILPTTSNNSFTNNNNLEQMNVGDTTYGSYFNWCVATAKTGGCRGNNTNNSDGETEAAGSVCPKNWRLPTKAEQDVLVSLGAASFDLYFYPGPIIHAGAFNTSSGVQNRDSRSGWWSSTQVSTTSSYYLARSSNLGTGSLNKYVGLSVRCVLSAE